MAWGIVKAKVRVPRRGPLAASPGAAAMTTVSVSGTVTRASKVKRASGESWQGMTLRAWMAWHWLNR